MKTFLISVLFFSAFNAKADLCTDKARGAASALAGQNNSLYSAFENEEVISANSNYRFYLASNTVDRSGMPLRPFYDVNVYSAAPTKCVVTKIRYFDPTLPYTAQQP